MISNFENDVSAVANTCGTVGEQYAAPYGLNSVGRLEYNERSRPMVTMAAPAAMMALIAAAAFIDPATKA